MDDDSRSSGPSDEREGDTRDDASVDNDSSHDGIDEDGLVGRMLVGSFPPVTPDPELWDRIARETRTSPTSHPRKSPPESGRQPRRIGVPRWVPLVAAAAVLVLVVGSMAVVARSMARSDVAAGGVVHTRVLIDPESGEAAMTIATVPEGTTSVTAADLRALDESSTYQLWSVVGDEIVSVGLLGSDVTGASFRIEGDPTVLALTVETAGGVAVSTQQPVAVWQAPS